MRLVRVQWVLYGVLVGYGVLIGYEYWMLKVPLEQLIL